MELSKNKRAAKAANKIPKIYKRRLVPNALEINLGLIKTGFNRQRLVEVERLVMLDDNDAPPQIENLDDIGHAYS